MTPLEKLRKRLGESRVEFGQRVGLSHATIEKYESEPTKDLVGKLIEICKERGFSDIEAMLKDSPEDSPEAIRSDALRSDADTLRRLEEKFDIVIVNSERIIDMLVELRSYRLYQRTKYKGINAAQQHQSGKHISETERLLEEALSALRGVGIENRGGGAAGVGPSDQGGPVAPEEGRGNPRKPNQKGNAA